MCSSNEKWNNDKCQCECKKYGTCKKDYRWNPSIYICDNSKRLQYIIDYSVVVCDETVYVMDTVSTNVANKQQRRQGKQLYQQGRPTNVSTDYNGKKSKI